MDELSKSVSSLKSELEKTLVSLDLPAKNQQLAKLEAELKRPDFWADNQGAQATVKKQADLSKRLKPWQRLQAAVNDLKELVELNDDKMVDELKQQFDSLSDQYNELKVELKFDGPYDDHGAILSLYAGAGGTDAQDWTQMLLRMYVRWAEKTGLGVKTAEESAGDEAGLKSVTIEIDGDFAYGKLKAEQGVHRLVRLSPFNADNLRQTSFARVDVMPVIDQPDQLKLDDKDLRVDVYRSSGHGGQSVNTTDSAVRVTHLPTAISVAIQNERSQLQNKEMALKLLRSKLAQLQLEQHAEKLSELKGPNKSAEWGNQIRSYVLHPYKQVKDLRTKFESSDPDSVLNGQLDGFINSYLDQISKLS